MAASRMILGRAVRSMLIACAVCFAWPIAHAAWTPLAEPGLSSTPLAGEPQAIAISDTARLAAVALRDAKAVAFVNIDSGNLLGQVSLNRKPTALMFNAAGTRAYVLCDESNKVAVIDVATRTVLATWTIGNEPSALAFDPVESQLVVADGDQRKLRALDPATGSELRILALDFSPRQLVFSANGQRLIVGGKGLLVSLDAASWNEITRVTVGDDIRSLAWWDSGALALAVGKKQDALNLINAETGAITARIALDGDPDAVALSQSEDRAFVSTREDLSVNRVELGPRTLTGRYPLPGRAGGVAFDPLTRMLLITQPKDDLLLKLDPAQASLIAALTLNQGLRDIAINNVTHGAVAIADKSDALSRIKLSDRSVQVVPLSATPQYVQVDTGLNRAVVSLRKAREEIAFVDLSGATPSVYPERIDFADEIRAIAVDSTRALTVVLTKGTNRIHLVDNATRTVVASLPSSENFETLAIHSGRGIAYLVAEDKKLLLFDLATRALTQAISLTFKVDGIAVDEALDRAVLTTSSGDRAYVLDLASLMLTANFVLPRHPDEVAIQQETHLAVITSRESGALSLIDLQTLQATASFSTLQKPSRLALSTRYNQAWVLSAERDEIAIVQLPNPVPVLNQVVPSQVGTGTPTMTLMVHGEHFIDRAQVRFGTTALLARWQSHALLFADVPAALLASLRSVSVTVVQPGPGGGVSNALSFQVLGPAPSLTSGPSNSLSLPIASPAPVIDSISPTSGAIGSTVTLTGRGLNALPANNTVALSGGAQAPVLTPTGSMNTPRTMYTLTLLPDGRVLAAGGWVSGTLTNTAEIYDPATERWTATGSMTVARADHTATLLKNGKVLVAGGYNGVTVWEGSAEIYDPVTGAWTATGSLITARWVGSAAPLKDGRVLMSGGSTPTSFASSAEIYDPTTGRWTETGSMHEPRYYHQTVTLQDGRVLVTGGAPNWLASAEVYDPASGTWSPTGPLPFAPSSADYDYTLTALRDGRVLFEGTRPTAALYDPVAGGWTPTPAIPNARKSDSATLLLDGTLFLSGTISGPLLFDPVLQSWTVLSGPSVAFRSRAVRLLDGRVLVAGGSCCPTSNLNLGVTEAFLFTGAPGTVVPSLTMEVTAPTTLTVASGTYAGNPFTVSARVSNTGAGTATNVDVSAFLPDGLTLATGSLTQSIGDLAPGQQQDVVWTVRAAGQKLDTIRTYFIRALSSNAAGQSETKQILLPGNALTVNSITPSAGGDTGSVTIHVNGGGIFNGATAKLVRTGEADIVGQGVNVSGNGFSLTSTFDLSGKSHGTWSLIVANPDGTAATLADAFAVEGGRAADVWVDIIGPSAVRSGRPTMFYIEYGNRGNVDSSPSTIWVALPKSVVWLVTDDITFHSIETDADEAIVIFPSIGVTAGQSRVIRIRVTVNGSFNLRAGVATD